MAALQKFKLLATQCGVAQTSPVVVFRRRKISLRMLLSGRRSPRPPHCTKDAGRSLRDLFVSSPPKDEPHFASDGFASPRIGSGSLRSGWAGFRNRSLLRKVWRPVLVGIPE